MQTLQTRPTKPRKRAEQGHGANQAPKTPQTGSNRVPGAFLNEPLTGAEGSIRYVAQGWMGQAPAWGVKLAD